MHVRTKMPRLILNSYPDPPLSEILYPPLYGIYVPESDGHFHVLLTRDLTGGVHHVVDPADERVKVLHRIHEL